MKTLALSAALTLALAVVISTSASAYITREEYHALGRPCACPDDPTTTGSLCGKKSAYCRCGGYEPLCYPNDGKLKARHHNQIEHCGYTCVYGK